jgi:PAS domain-containing protein
MEFYIELFTALFTAVAAIGISTRKILVALRRNWEQTQPNSGNSLRDSINRIEASVAEVRALNRGYLNLTGGGIFTADNEGSCTWVSREFSQLTGVEHEAARGTGWLAGVADEHRMRVHDEWSMFVGSRGAIEFDSLFSTATGVEVRGRAVPVEADCGSYSETISGYFGQFRPLGDIRATDPITGAS